MEGCTHFSNPIVTYHLIKQGYVFFRKMDENVDRTILKIAEISGNPFSYKAELEQKDKKLKELNLSKKKTDIVELSALIMKWRTVCQKALIQLHEKSTSCCRTESIPTLGQFLDTLGVDKGIVQFDDEEDSFK